MWLRSEHVSRRLRGRLGTAVVSTTKGPGRRIQGGTVRKAPAINNSSQRVHTTSKCGRLSRWQRHSPSLLKEVRMHKHSCTLYFVMMIIVREQ